MFDSNEYELVDFGDGRKLERFGDALIDRPCPAAEEHTRRQPDDWSQVTARFTRKVDQGSGGAAGTWRPAKFAKDEWVLSGGDFKLSLKPTQFGHLGVFPEQAGNWEWVTRKVAAALKANSDDPPNVLNLFAYTGGSTLAAAAAGAKVVHVDSAKNVVGWARQNAQLSGLGDAPIRWIAEDAVKFVERELKRGNKYDAVILDPPSYGHGPKGEVWKVQTDLMRLLRGVKLLTEGQRLFILLSCHSPGFGPAELQACLSDSIFGSCQAGGTSSAMTVQTKAGRKLPAGAVARWPN